MTVPANPADFLGYPPDDRLLGKDMAMLPESERRPVPVPDLRARRLVVGAGVALTGASLVVGIALIAYGLIAGLADAFSTVRIVALVVGAALVATHWGWVHVAELVGGGLEGRALRGVRRDLTPWLEGIHPYTRWSVVTDVMDDGSLRIRRLRHSPVRTIDGAFTFSCEPESEEVHSGDLPGAEIAERAEAMRRQAALDSERERRRYELAADAYETALLRAGAEEDQVAARRAASAALSEGINRNLREPPLAE
jgi:hypothetical protein